MSPDYRSVQFANVMSQVFLLANVHKWLTDYSKSHFWSTCWLFDLNFSTIIYNFIHHSYVHHSGRLRSCSYEEHGERACVFSLVHSRWGCVKLHCDRIVQRVELSECKGSAVTQGRISVKLLFGLRRTTLVGKQCWGGAWWFVSLLTGAFFHWVLNGRKCCLGRECPK